MIYIHFFLWFPGSGRLHHSVCVCKILFGYFLIDFVYLSSLSQSAASCSLTCVLLTSFVQLVLKVSVRVCLLTRCQFLLCRFPLLFHVRLHGLRVLANCIPVSIYVVCLIPNTVTLQLSGLVWFSWCRLESNCSITRDLKWGRLNKSPLLCVHFTRFKCLPIAWNGSFVEAGLCIHFYRCCTHSFISYSFLFLFILKVVLALFDWTQWDYNWVNRSWVCPLITMWTPPVPIVSRPSIKITCSCCRIAPLSPRQHGLQMKGEWETVQ